MRLGVIAAAAFCASLVCAAELPVRTVVVYKHGVGYFERAGTLGPGESARLDFKPEEMNDVLKSLTVSDQGGRITALRYDSSIPLDQKLKEFPFRLNAGEPLSAVLDQLKGARIEMEFGPQKIAGEIVSARVVPGDKDRPEREQLTLLTDSGELRNTDLAAASAIRFSDPALQLQFKDYLAALTGARSKDKRSVYIDSTDAKSRDVRAEYIMPMPAWKSSYRLLFGESGVQPTLEGWAIVDNTTGEDWSNVRMSLVSGKPISFISQLYAPKYIQRIEAGLPEDVALAPTLHEGVIGGVLGAAPPPPPAKPKAPAAPVRIGGNIKQDLAQSGIQGAEMSTISTAGASAEIADLFEYSIATAVTVRKDESAMLPFLQQKIAARKLVIYSDPTKPNPLIAAELTNNTGKTLDGGPITVYDQGAYAGEALVETVKNGDKRFISYGVDLGTRISTNLNTHAEDVRELHARNGILTTRAAMVQTRTYTVRNVDPRAKILIVEYPVHEGYSLINTQKPIETARNVYRFEVPLAANGSADFPVTEERVYDTQTAVSSISPDVLLNYIRNKSLSEVARRQLQQILEVKTQIANNDADKHSASDAISSIARDEDRNRENIRSLSSVSGQQQLVQDYARKLADQETQIAKLRDREYALDQQHADLQTRLNNLIAGLDF